MPNHVHILFEIDSQNVLRGEIDNVWTAENNNVWTGRDLSIPYNTLIPCDTNIETNDNALKFRDLSLRFQNDIKIKSVSSIMGAYKTTTSKQIHNIGNIDFCWQRSFYDHIVRDQRGYDNIFNYITENPSRWKDDTFNKDTNPNYIEND